VLHGEPEAFERDGGLIRHCPSCPSGTPTLTGKQRERLAAVREVAGLLGADVDGLASALEEFDLL
jgi:hypothetical protein